MTDGEISGFAACEGSAVRVPFPVEHSGRPVSYEELYAAVHGYSSGGWDLRQALSTHLWRLRRKLGESPDGNPYIVNVRGRGYKFLGNT